MGKAWDDLGEALIVFLDSIRRASRIDSVLKTFRKGLEWIKNCSDT